MDKEKLKQSQAMINELCEEFLKTLDSCTSNIVQGEDKDTSVLQRPSSHSFTEGSLQSPVSLGSYFPPPLEDHDVCDPLVQTTDISSDILAPNQPENKSRSWNDDDHHSAGCKRVSKLPCTYFSDIPDRFEDLYLKGDAIPTVAFLGQFYFIRENSDLLSILLIDSAVALLPVMDPPGVTYKSPYKYG